MAGITTDNANESGAPLDAGTLTVAYLPAGIDPLLVTIPKEDHLKALQLLVGGSIEEIYPSADVTFFGESEARINGKPPNTLATAMCVANYGYPIVGDIVASCSDGMGEMVSIDPSLIPYPMQEQVIPWDQAVDLVSVFRSHSW